MKRFVACLSVFMLLLGLRLCDNGILACGYLGEYAEWTDSGVTYFDELPLLANNSCSYSRLDFFGAQSDVFFALQNLGASVKWSEDLGDGLTVVYAYAPQIFNSVLVGSIKINLMVAYNSNTSKISVGSPVLAGSY